MPRFRSPRPFPSPALPAAEGISSSQEEPSPSGGAVKVIPRKAAHLRWLHRVMMLPNHLPCATLKERFLTRNKMSLKIAEISPASVACMLAVLDFLSFSENQRRISSQRPFGVLSPLVSELGEDSPISPPCCAILPVAATSSEPLRFDIELGLRAAAVRHPFLSVRLLDLFLLFFWCRAPLAQRGGFPLYLTSTISP